MDLVQEHTNLFLDEIMDLFPQTQADILEDADLLHLQFGSIARLANAAIASGDWTTYVTLCNLIDRYYQPLNEDLLPFINAVNVSFLEMLDIENGRNPEAWAITPPRLQQGFIEMMDYLDALFDASKRVGTMISTSNAPHYTWAEVCDSWHLTSASTLSVIQERMLPGMAEKGHKHSRVRQFFFVLSGTLTLEVEVDLKDVQHVLGAQQGLEVPQGQTHQARNEHGQDAEFLVISDGISGEDRQETP